MKPTKKSNQPGSPFLSIVTPAYNESENLPVLYARLRNVLENMDVEWEWIVVDDHSTDNTFHVLQQMAKKDSHLFVLRFSRNFGAHSALRCGLIYAEGNCAVVLAGDLQDPPEEIPRLVEEWKNGMQIVWAVRKQQEGLSPLDAKFSKMYYRLMRSTTALQDMPPEGSDFFLIDRLVIDAFKQFDESNVSIFGLITWMGFKQAFITYTKQARLHGSSGWNLKKKVTLLVDSITSFTYFPIRLMSYVGLTTSFLGFLYAIVVVGNFLLGKPVMGWSSLIIVTLVIGGIQMLMLGVLGEYLWRSLDQARHRPPYIIEAISGRNKTSQEYFDFDKFNTENQ